MAKEKNQNSYIIPKRYVYIFWGVSYAFCTLVLFYLSKRYYKPIEICDETNSVLDIIWDELGNSITVASGLLCLLMNFISQREKQIEPWIKRIIAIRRLVKSLQLDVLIGMSFAMTWYAVLATMFTKTKSVGTERSNPYRYKATKLNTFLRKFFYNFTDGYVFQTRRAAQFFGNKKSERDIIIPNAIFNETVYSLSPPAERKKIICATGRLIKLKRFDLLIDAFAKIADQIPDYMLFIFGDGEEKEDLENQIEYLGLKNRIILAGTDPQAVRFVNFASVFVLSSDFEGMPNALLEALAMGVPCVSTRCEMGPDELIENRVSGILTDVGSSEQLAEAMLEIIENPDFAKKLSENGRKLLKTHSIENISRQWLDYLSRI